MRFWMQHRLDSHLALSHVTMATITINGIEGKILIFCTCSHHPMPPAGHKWWKCVLSSTHAVFPCAVHRSVLLSLMLCFSFTMSFVCALFPEAPISLCSVHDTVIYLQVFAIHTHTHAHTPFLHSLTLHQTDTVVCLAVVHTAITIQIIFHCQYFDVMVNRFIIFLPGSEMFR